MSERTVTAPSGESDALPLSGFWDNVRIIFYALLLALIMRCTVAQPFKIPTPSMEPTLIAGDYIVVTKWSYGFGRYSFSPFESVLPPGRVFPHMPERGQVVVFHPVGEPSGHDFVKRLIGLPGDRVQMRAGVLYLNGQAVPREPLGDIPFKTSDGRIEEVLAYRETLPGGPSYVIFERDGDRGGLDNTIEFLVPKDSFFMMGDNRDNSDDSRRTVGFVPFDNLIGPAQFVAASFDDSTTLSRPWTLFTGFRKERFLKRLD